LRKLAILIVRRRWWVIAVTLVALPLALFAGKADLDVKIVAEMC